MIRSTRIHVALAILATVVAASAAGCGGGGGGADTLPDVVTDVPADVPADVPPDTVTDPGQGEDVTPVDPGTPDTADVTDVPPTTCTPACLYGDGKYCDETAKECKTVSCALCLRDADCEGGLKCMDYAFENGAHDSLCSKECAADADCPAGFACGTGTPKMCVPRAACAASCGTGTGALGEACPKEGVNGSCAACAEGLTCIGSAAVAGTTCEVPRECVSQGFGREMHPDCVDGKCGSSICASSCMTSDCPTGFMKFRPSFAACWCVPEGKAAAGDACPVFNVNPDSDSCNATLTCLGIEAKDTSDACTKDSDCPKANYYGNPDCVDGFCGTSFCSPKCGTGNTCPVDFSPMDVSGTCYCIPMPVGTSAAGAACPIFNVHPTADDCQSGLTCLGIEAKSDGTACTTDAECPKTDFIGNPQCVGGFCGTSFCAPRCDDHGRCSGAFQPIEVGDGSGGSTCYCAPTEVGTSAAGAPCPFGAMHGSASLCAADLICLGITPSDTTAACTTAADCPKDLFYNNAECIDGHCGASFCSPYCDDNLRCGSGFVPEGIGNTCLCTPTLVGTTPALGPCPSGKSNADKDYCAANLTCIGDADWAMLALCATDADCSDLPNGDCVDGVCGYSYCAAYCDDANACTEGSTPVYNGAGTCLCAKAGPPAGNAVFGDACPWVNVHQGTERCGADLECQGLWSWAKAPACTTAAECPAIPALPWDCVQGHCGFSSCVSPCTAGACTTGTPFVAANSAVCECWNLAAGTAKAGQACSYRDVNLASGGCEAGLACIGREALPLDSTECTTVADCPAAEFRGTAVCQEGTCGSSFCAAKCGAGNTCDTGFEPLMSGADCWCQPVVPTT